MGRLGGSAVEGLPLAQGVISEFWDQVPHQVPCQKPASPLPMSLAYVSVFSLCFSWINKWINKILKKKKTITCISSIMPWASSSSSLTIIYCFMNILLKIFLHVCPNLLVDCGFLRFAYSAKYSTWYWMEGQLIFPEKRKKEEVERRREWRGKGDTRIYLPSRDTDIWPMKLSIWLDSLLLQVCYVQIIIYYTLHIFS